MAGPGRPKSRKPLEELYTDPVKRQLGEFRKLMDKKGWSERRGARVLGCSVTVLNRLLRFDYPADPTDWIAKMQRQIRRESLRTHMPVQPDFVSTSVAERVEDVLRLAQVERAVALIMGGTGVGKTMAVQHYCDSEPDAVYVVAGPGASAAALLKVIAGRLAISISSSSILALRQALVETLGGTDRLLIIDEADYMTESALQSLRIIRDEAGIGLVIVCTPAYLDKLRARRSSTINQFLGRVDYTETVPEAPSADLEMIASQFKLDDDALRVLIDGSCGSARRCRAALVAAQRTNGGEFSAHGIAEAFNQLMPTSLED